MYMNKILILGNGGSGKTTLAEKISLLTKAPILHLDKIYWKNGWKKPESSLFEGRLNQVLDQQQWIIEGTPMLGLEHRLAYADFIIFLDIHRLTCLFRVFKRWSLRLFNLNTKKDSCPFGARLSPKALLWIWRFEDKQRKTIMDLLKDYKDKSLLVKNNRDVTTLLYKINAQIHRSRDIVCSSKIRSRMPASFPNL